MSFISADTNRAIHIAKRTIAKLKLNLSGLTVLTECASGGYIFTPVIARLAGARVFCVGKNSHYGLLKDNKKLLNSIFKKFHIKNDLDIFENEFPPEIWKQADIVTNSGFVRPITKKHIALLKKTAVIPLMWETWEFRKQDIDLIACQEYKIPVIGTNEHFNEMDMYLYPAMIAMKLLFTLGIEIANNDIVLIGGKLTGSLIAEKFDKIGIRYRWFTPTGKEKKDFCYKYDDLRQLLQFENIDAVICAEHRDKRVLVSKNGLIDFHDIYKKFPHMKWGHICGNIDAESLKESGLDYYPKKIRLMGYMSYETNELGVRPVIELNSAGLKVGEIAAKARLSGAIVEQAIEKTIRYGIGQDFDGGFFNYKLI
jgi:hypothetical protein